MTVDYINEQNSKLVIVGWFVGLAYFNWLASDGISLAWWIHLSLIIVGMFSTSILIGGGMAMLAARANKATYGDPDARPGLFKLAGLIATVFAFFAAKYALIIVGKI